MKRFFKYSAMVLGLALALGASARAQSLKPNIRFAPEINPSLAVSALALLGGTLTVFRARKGK
jgi:hypothetical protein